MTGYTGVNSCTFACVEFLIMLLIVYIRLYCCFPVLFCPFGGLSQTHPKVHAKVQGPINGLLRS